MIIEQIDKNTFDLNLLRDKESEFYFVEIMEGRFYIHFARDMNKPLYRNNN